MDIAAVHHTEEDKEQQQQQHLQDQAAPDIPQSAAVQPLPTILQDDLPLDGSTTTTLSFENGIHPSTMMDSSAQSVLTDTLSSFSSTHSSYLGGSNNNNHHGNTLSTVSSTTSTSASRRNSMQFTKPIEVRETLDAHVTENADGFRQLKQYVLKQEIGKGAFGKVHLGIDETTGVAYAVKEFSKSKLRKKDKANLFKLGPRGRGRGARGPAAPSPTSTAESSPLDLIRGEIAILKKLHHPNIVKLYEVLDVATDDSMYMVFEFCERGVLMPVSLTTKYEHVFSDEECRDVFQQIVLGIEYLHEHDIIHRDIKPDNLLRSGDGTVKIVDFGVSEMFNKKGDDLTKKSAGSPAFMAPELCRPDHGQVSGRATDVWSMGVTLYCLRYGRLPYISESILDMQRVIREEDLVIPEEKDPRFEELIKKLLEKDPIKRVTIEQLRSDAWLTNDGKENLISKEENTVNAVTEVTEEDLRGAIQKINSLVTVFKAIARFKRGIKSPGPRSSPVSAGEDSPAAATASESERMQDADEGQPANIAQVLAVPTTTEQTTNGASAGASASTSAEGASSSSVQENLGDSALNNTPLDEEPSLNVDGDQVKAEKEASGAAAEAVKQDAVPTPVTEDAKKDESAAVAAEPEGYQVCDMESGMCYWVPAKKINTSSPSTASVSESKDTAVESQSIADVAAAAAAEPEVKEHVVPEIQVGSEETTGSAEASSPQLTSEEMALPATTTSTTPPRAVSPHLDESNGSTTTTTRQEESESGSTSPAQSLNPPVPRLVGKLSRDRLAMFEKSG
ncbi:hypothetical protein EDD11_009837 [Mortierella claussenii]|nr:hypothetical protein EDD11_009837 [Mortierella claussenii]